VVMIEWSMTNETDWLSSIASLSEELIDT
jgi:hypothetical protein